MRHFAYILLALTLLASTAHAQEQAQPDTTAVKAKAKKAPLFEHYEVALDLVGPVMNALGEQGDYQAVLTASLRGKYFPVIEIGYGKADKYDELTKIGYKTSAPFGRIGCDINVLRDKHDDYRLVVGARLGYTSFSYDTTAPDSTMTTINATSDKCNLLWGELLLGVDAKVWGPLHMGWSLRYRRRLKISDHTDTPLYAPGFGNADNGTRFMALYTIALQF